MMQLKFDFDEKSLIDDYKSVSIDKGSNQIFKWDDTLSEDKEKISYHEYIYDTPEYMDFENWIYIKKNGLGRYAFWWFKMYLSSIKSDKDRIGKLKRLLLDMGIPFEEGDWQTIDRDRERKDNEKKTTRH